MTDSTRFGELVTTGDGSLTVRNPDIDEEYHSQHGALFETEELYLKQSGFLDRLKSGQATSVLDVGLGLGYNALAAIDAWIKEEGAADLRVLSLEKNPELVKSIAQNDGPWCKSWPSGWGELSTRLEKLSDLEWKGTISHPNGSVLHWTVLVGDSSQLALPEGLNLHIVFQDAFSPKKNPELWSQEWFSKVMERSSPEVVLVTYSVARVVKDGLEGSGWEYKRIPAPGNKKHWLLAKKSVPAE